jgi:transmembrane 9 superfamily protein 3
VWLLVLPLVQSDDVSQTYKAGEEVTVWTNKIGPYHNPQENYDYYDLPFCRPQQGKEIRHKHNSLGVVLEGEDLLDSGIHIQYKAAHDNTALCSLKITPEIEVVFVNAVKNHYWYQMYIDELPVWGMVGEYMQEASLDGQANGKEQGFLYTHREFSISYNDNQIIEVNLTSEKPMPIVAGKTLDFTFSVRWTKSSIAFKDRYDRYHDFDFFEHQIHWFSIFNSFMMVIFLVGMVALILMRTLKNDFTRFTSEEDDLELHPDESGWKQVHGDVFRPPRNAAVYAALLGTGYQLFFVGFFVISIVLLGTFYHERGTIATVSIVGYCLTSFVAGYTGGSYYKRNNGKKWKQVMVMTASLIPGLFFGMALMLNFISVFYDATPSLSFKSMFVMMLIWVFVQNPLVFVGTIVGRSMANAGDHPCRVNAFCRPIPDGKWYTRKTSIVLMSGILPFSSIFIEMYFIFTSFLNYKFYYVYGFMFLVYCILILVTMSVTIVGTYFLLNAEDYHWQWTCFFSGGSTALYVYIYSIYYFFSKTRMTGILQTFYYFGYMGVFCISLGVLCGTIGYMGSNMFVRRIYQYIKSD